jgi:polysaccharide biosynthesis protein PslH
MKDSEMSKIPRILYVVPYCPAPPRHGGQTVIFQRLRALATFASVELVCPPPTNPIDVDTALFMLRAYCREIHFCSAANNFWKKHPLLWHVRGSFSRFTCGGAEALVNQLPNRVSAILREGSIDLVIVEHIYLAAVLIRYATVRPGTPVLLFEQNVEHIVSFDMGNDPNISRIRRVLWKIQAHFLKRMEGTYYPLLNAILHISKVDCDIMRRMCPRSNVRFVPPHFAASSFHKTDYARSGTITFFGTLGYFPNREGLFWFLHDIWPAILKEMPDVKLQIIGTMDQKMKILLSGTPNVLLRESLSHEEADQEVIKSDLVISPIRFGSGIKIKNIISMSLAMPIVATSSSASGLLVTPGSHMIVADEPHAFAENLLELLKNTPLRENMGKKARECFEHQYSGNAPIQHLQKLIAELLMSA